MKKQLFAVSLPSGKTIKRYAHQAYDAAVKAKPSLRKNLNFSEVIPQNALDCSQVWVYFTRREGKRIAVYKLR